MRESISYAQLFISLLILLFLAGYSFFDSGDIDLLRRRQRSPCVNIGVSERPHSIFCQR
jgi:hypothetical protein